MKPVSRNSKLIGMVLVRLIFSFLALAAAFFLPAGSLNYWQAWAYLAVLFIPLCLVMIYLARNHPGMLERRMRYHEREKEQQLIVKFLIITFAIAFILPGLDYRFGWSHVPVWLVCISLGIVLVAYIFIVSVFRTNQYASRTVEVEQEQTVITSGPYSIIRHPMYLGTAIMYVFSPLALGSFWAIIPALGIIPVLVFRLLNEEKVLERDLKGYREYEAKVKYHLFPGIW